MSNRFKGVINVDIRDSVPDWAPFEAPKASEGAPNVLYIVLDDMGFSVLSGYGGPCRRRTSIGAPRTGCATPDVHDGVVLADALMPADWS